MAKQKSKSKSNKSKPKKQTSCPSSSSTDDAAFLTTLLNQGHTIQEMQSNGNCLFRPSRTNSIAIAARSMPSLEMKHAIIYHSIEKHSNVSY
jgi:hypothetical protein